jgi:hypothetical protein
MRANERLRIMERRDLPELQGSRVDAMHDDFPDRRSHWMQLITEVRVVILVLGKATSEDEGDKQAKQGFGIAKDLSRGDGSPVAVGAE